MHVTVLAGARFQLCPNISPFTLDRGILHKDICVNRANINVDSIQARYRHPVKFPNPDEIGI